MSVQKEIESKIHALDELKDVVHSWQQSGETVVFTNGCFDLLHKGHVDYLNKARDLGDRLVVALNSDASVSRLKGSHRPIQGEDSRALIMASLECVSAVVLFEEDTPQTVIETLVPDVLVKGGDYNIESIVGADVVTQAGGKVTTIPFLPGYSTSSIEEKIRNQQ